MRKSSTWRNAYDDSKSCHECWGKIERGDQYLHVFGHRVWVKNVPAEDYCFDCGKKWEESNER